MNTIFVYTTSRVIAGVLPPSLSRLDPLTTHSRLIAKSCDVHILLASNMNFFLINIVKILDFRDYKAIDAILDPFKQQRYHSPVKGKEVEPTSVKCSMKVPD